MDVVLRDKQGESSVLFFNDSLGSIGGCFSNDKVLCLGSCGSTLDLLAFRSGLFSFPLLLWLAGFGFLGILAVFCGSSIKDVDAKSIGVLFIRPRSNPTKKFLVTHFLCSCWVCVSLFSQPLYLGF